MSDRIRQTLAFVIAIGMITAVAAAPTVAQVADPGSERVLQVAGLNADTVDGRHAVAWTTNKTKRAKKLVSTNKYGMLPANIVKPKWSTIAGMPGGFADGVDNKGVTGVTITRVTGSVDVPAGAARYAYAKCPSNSRLVGGGFSQNSTHLKLLHSLPLSDGRWQVRGLNESSFSSPLYAYALCMGTTPSGAIATAAKDR